MIDVVGVLAIVSVVVEVDTGLKDGTATQAGSMLSVSVYNHSLSVSVCKSLSGVQDAHLVRHDRMRAMCHWRIGKEGGRV